MSDRGRFSGFCWHEEYHTIDRKKDKAADCIYLTEDRICRNSKCVQYGEKCFVATHCPYRIKEKKAEKQRPEEYHEKKIVSIRCTIPKGSAIYSKAYGKGKYSLYNTRNRMIAVDFECGTKVFLYPEAFMQGFICVEGDVYKHVQRDIQMAEKV